MLAVFDEWKLLGSIGVVEDHRGNTKKRVQVFFALDNTLKLFLLSLSLQFVEEEKEEFINLFCPLVFIPAIFTTFFDEVNNLGKGFSFVLI